MHLVLVNHLGVLRLPRNSVVRLTSRSDMTIAVYHGHAVTYKQSLEGQNLPL